jgi:hypothetical protein
LRSSARCSHPRPARAPAFVTESGSVALTCLSAPPTTFPRFARGVVLPGSLGSVTVPLLSFTWPPGLVPGTYVFFLALTPVDAFSDGTQPTDILALGTAAVVQPP